MSSNFNIESPISIKELEYYVPIFGVIGYEGYSSNRFETVGNQLLRIWQPIQPYTYVDASGNIIRFTLDDYVYVYDRVSFDKPKWLEGTREMLINTFHSNILALQDATEFEQRRRQTIVLQNKKDKYAVKVLTETNVILGYIAAVHSESISKVIENNQDYKVIVSNIYPNAIPQMKVWMEVKGQCSFQSFLELGEKSNSEKELVHC